MRNSALLILLVALLSACSSEVYTPKPKAYPRIVYPTVKGFSMYSNDECPFSFEYPAYTNVIKDSIFFGELNPNPCWMDINYPDWNGTIHMSYKEIEDGETFAKLVDDAYKLTMKHTKKADYIDETRIQNNFGTTGLLYDVGGNAATPLQFYVTDNEAHFVRAALYFSTAPNADSLAPVVDFVRADIEHLLATFQWN